MTTTTESTESTDTTTIPTQSNPNENMSGYITIDVNHYQELLKRSDEYIKLNQALFLHQMNTDEIIDAVLLNNLQHSYRISSDMIQLIEIKKKLKQSTSTLDVEKKQDNQEQEQQQQQSKINNT